MLLIYHLSLLNLYKQIKLYAFAYHHIQYICYNLQMIVYLAF